MICSSNSEPVVHRHYRLLLFLTPVPEKAWAFVGSAVAVGDKLLYGMLDGDYLLEQELFHLNPQASCYTQAELYIGTAEMAELERDNRVAFGTSNALHRSDDVIDKMLPLSVGQHVAEEIPGLGVVVVVARHVAVVPVSYRGLQGEWGLFVALVDSNIIEAIRPVVGATATVAIDPHEAVTLVICHGKGTPVDWELFVVDAQAIAVCVRVRQQTSLQHLVW
jgi:hypothetical protein